MMQSVSPDEKPQIIMIDNYDSFTYNLVNQFKIMGATVITYRNDVALEKIFTKQRLKKKNTLIVISPGPGDPDSAGNTLEILHRFSGVLPILGICLGHQAIVQHFGGNIKKAQQVVHGKAELVTFENDSPLAHFSNHCRVARYHSLIAENIPAPLKVIARINNEIMGVQHRLHKTIGFQFHPESILTTHGSEILLSTTRWLLDDRTYNNDTNKQLIN